MEGTRSDTFCMFIRRGWRERRTVRGLFLKPKNAEGWVLKSRWPVMAAATPLPATTCFQSERGRGMHWYKLIDETRLSCCTSGGQFSGSRNPGLPKQICVSPHPPYRPMESSGKPQSKSSSKYVENPTSQSPSTLQILFNIIKRFKDIFPGR